MPSMTKLGPKHYHVSFLPTLKQRQMVRGSDSDSCFSDLIFRKIYSLHFEAKNYEKLR